MFSSLAVPSLPGRGAVRLAAGALVSALAVAGVAAGTAPATAAQDGAARGQGGATATIGGLKTHGTAVIHGEDGDQQVPAGLFEMSVEGGGMLQTYCVDIQNPTQKDAKYRETSWSATSLGTNKDAGRVRWILQHSYPQVNDLAALAKKAGVGALTEEEAAAGTQVAIWRYSDDTDVEAVDPQAERLADYLEKNARNLAEPAASLALDPPAVSGRPGERLGPVTVHTNAGGATVTPPVGAADEDAVRIVDKKGRPVTKATDGTQLFFDVPEDAEAGTAQLSVQASTTVPVGRAFASDSRSQTQILAGSSESTVAATATATWAAEGAIPALSATENCTEGTLDITALNKGDEPFTFQLLDTEYTIAPGETRTVPVPLPEDRPYDFTIRGPAGFEQRFAGVLDCRTQSAALADTTHPLSEPAPATVVTPSPNPNLAETGSSDTTPLIGGAAIGLVVIGGAVLLLVRRRNEQ
ncbi:Cys-Gln thioester bond-forming surface protein [Streptomyces sp. NBC_01124]|uniref:Cys-Gln thioester bond-forming surface protein n=1 Tax=Streptomyces sp. NBC_01124 TaxID=2903753 RepID=UPI003870179C|nr:Cys-Gln thioester bond-forming surface protein [Streptomyces sp. NBC_01124]